MVDWINAIKKIHALDDNVQVGVLYCLRTYPAIILSPYSQYDPPSFKY